MEWMADAINHSHESFWGIFLAFSMARVACFSLVLAGNRVQCITIMVKSLIFRFLDPAEKKYQTNPL